MDIFLCVGGGEWRYILGEWGWIDIFYVLVGLDGGRWRYILGDSEWVDISYGWVGMSGCGGDIFCLGEGGLTFFMGG